MRYDESEGTGLQLEPSLFVEAEHEVHVLHGLADGSLQEVVDAGNHQELVFVLLHIDKGLVGVHHLLHVGTLRDEMCEGGVLVVVGIDALHLFKWHVAPRVGCDEDAAGETAALRDEEHATSVAWAELLHRLVYLQEMLMREGLVDGDVVVAPREVRRSARLLSCARTACDAVHVDVAADDAGLQSGQHGKLDACGEATGVGKVLAAPNRLPVRLGQAIDEIMLAPYAEVLRQVDNLHPRRYLVFLKELFALAVSEAEEDDVHLVEGTVEAEPQLTVADQSLVYVADEVAGIALAVGEDNLRLRVVQQEPNQFATCVARCSKYANVYHSLR